QPVEAEPPHRGQWPGQRHRGLPPAGGRRSRHGGGSYPGGRSAVGEGPGFGRRGRGKAKLTPPPLPRSGDRTGAGNFYPKFFEKLLTKRAFFGIVIPARLKILDMAA